MDEYAVQTQNTICKFDIQDIIKRVEGIVVALEQFRAINLESITNRGGVWHYTTISVGYSIVDVNISVYKYNMLADMQDLDHTIKCSRLVLDAVKKGDKMPKISFVWDVATSTPTFYRYYLATIIKASECPQCHKQYTKSGMNSHMGSLRCLRDTQIRDVQQAGYVIVDDPAATNAIRKSGIEFKIRPQALDMWVPAWVDKAIQDYRKSSEFAGLKLHEFLRAINGESIAIDQTDQTDGTQT